MRFLSGVAIFLKVWYNININGNAKEAARWR